MCCERARKRRNALPRPAGVIPVALVRLDRTELALSFSRLRSRGVQDLGHHIDQNPEFLKFAMNSIEIVEANGKAAELFGVSDARQILGQCCYFGPKIRKCSGDPWKRFRGANRFEAEIRIRTFHQVVRKVLYVTEFPEARDDPALGLTSLIDIDDRIEAQEALDNLQAEIAHAS
jgi:PAS domain-containing protein